MTKASTKEQREITSVVLQFMFFPLTCTSESITSKTHVLFYNGLGPGFKVWRGWRYYITELYPLTTTLLQTFLLCETKLQSATVNEDLPVQYGEIQITAETFICFHHNVFGKRVCPLPPDGLQLSAKLPNSFINSSTSLLVLCLYSYFNIMVRSNENGKVVTKQKNTKRRSQLALQLITRTTKHSNHVLPRLLSSVCEKWGPKPQRPTLEEVVSAQAMRTARQSCPPQKTS